MNASALRAKWLAEAEQLRQRSALIVGAVLCEEFVADLDALMQSEQDTTVTLREAAVQSGYSVAHLRRLVREGKLAAVQRAGPRGRITVRAADLPRRALQCHTPDAGVHDLARRLYRGKEGRYGQS